LIGRAIDYLPYFIYTFDELGKIGIGKGRGRYELRRVKSLESGVKSEKKGCEEVIPQKTGIPRENLDEIIYSSDTKTIKPFTPSLLNFESSILNSEEILSFESSILNLSFITPTRIIYKGHLTINLEFHILIRQILRRLSLLSYFHCGIDPSQWDFKGIIEKSRQVIVKQRNLTWYDWERYSFRQDTRMKMGGFVGEITFEGNIEPFMPLIRAGEVLHVGKGTAFGLGKYEIISK